MSLKTKVKAGNITNLSDARYCAGMGVDFLGFPVGASFTDDLKRLSDIRSWVSGPAIVLECETPQPDQALLELLPSLNVDFVQVDVSVLDNFLATEVTLFVAIRLGDWDANKNVLKKHQPRIKYLVVDHEGDVSIHGDLLERIGSMFNILLVVGPDSDLSATLALPITGVAISGTPEEKPGLKEYSVADVLEQLEELG